MHRAAFLLLSSCLFASCGLFDNSEPVEVSTVALLKGTIKVFDFSEGTRGDELLSESFDNTNGTRSERSFSIAIEPSGKPLLFEVTDAQIEDWATGQSLQFDKNDRWQLTLPDLDAPRSVRITPFTTIASCLAAYHLQQEVNHDLEEIKQVILSINNLIGDHLGNIDITEGDAIPLHETVGNVTEDVTHSLLQAGYSRLAIDYSILSGVTPTKVINVLTLTKSLCDDVNEDGIFDGEAALGPILLGNVFLTDRTYRVDLAMGIIRFLEDGSINGSGIQPADVIPLGNQLASNTDPDLFPDDAKAFVLDFDPPQVGVLEPSGTAPELSGNQPIQIIASDNSSGVASVTVELVQITPQVTHLGVLSDSNNSPEVFTTMFDTTNHEDAAYFLDIQVIDILGNTAQVTFDFTIDNSS